MTGVIPSKEFNAQLVRTVKEINRRDRGNRNPRQARWHKKGGAAKCQDHFRIVLFGRPTGGSISLPVTINDVTESVTIQYNDDAADLSTAIQTHSEVTAASQVETGSPGGSLPYQEMWFYFKEDIEQKEVTVGNAVDSLTGGDNPYSLVRRPGAELS